MQALQESTVLEQLRRTCLPVETSEEAKVIVSILESTLRDLQGLYSLSAPEAGIKATVAIIRTPSVSCDLINPVVIHRDQPIISPAEVCFSFPQKRLNCVRYNRLLFKDGLTGREIGLTGQAAILAQHQIDHFQGVVYQDRAVRLAEIRIDGTIKLNDLCPCMSKKRFWQCCMEIIRGC